MGKQKTSLMESILLAAALAACAKDAQACSYTETDRGIVITACDLKPEENGRPITLEAYFQGRKHIITLEPKCIKV